MSPAARGGSHAGRTSRASARAISDNRAQVRVVGPGLGREAEPLLPELIAQKDAPTVLDAGAFRGDDAWFAAVRAHGSCVLTPSRGQNCLWAGEAGDRAGGPWDGVCQVSLFPSEGRGSAPKMKHGSRDESSLSSTLQAL